MTKCGDMPYESELVEHNNDVNCNLTDDSSENKGGDPVPIGQDGHYGRDTESNPYSEVDGHAGFSFTKLDANGLLLPQSAEDWDCILDNVTGMVWEKKIPNHPYRSPNKKQYSTAMKIEYMENLREDGVCGRVGEGWRLPSFEQLQSIVDYGKASPAIDDSYFPNTNIDEVYCSNRPDMHLNFDTGESSNVLFKDCIIRAVFTRE